MREFHVSWITKDADGYQGNWAHVSAKTSKDAGIVAERDLRAGGTELVRNGAGTYVAVDRISNCKH